MNIIFRVNGFIEIGTGHAIRCLRFTDELKIYIVISGLFVTIMTDF